MRRKNSLIAWVLLVCMLAALTGCGKDDPTNTPSAGPETTAPTESVPAAASGATLEQVEESGGLLSWEMSAFVWSSSNGANITFTAQPRAYEQGQSASFIVRLDGKEVENLSCDWDGTYYTATVDLEAADGYEYECVLFPPQGAGEHITLSDAYDDLVYMERSLNAYCNVYISDYKVEDGKFTVTAGWASVQLPQLTTAGTTVSFTSAELVFKLNDEAIETQAIEMPAGEGAGSHETSLSNISFTMPEMGDDYQLDLWLNVTLSNGEVLTAPGGSWFYNNNELRMNAG